MKARLLSRRELDPALWDDVVAQAAEGSPYHRSWFLDAIAPDGWQGIVAEDENGKWQGVMPFFTGKKFGLLPYSLQPILAKYGGPALRSAPELNTYETYSRKKKILEAMAAALPKRLLRFVMHCHPAFDYPLPFHWAGYKLGVRYTFRLNLEPPPAELRRGFHPNHRNEINRARKEGVEVVPATDIESLFFIFEENRRAGKAILSPDLYPGLRRLHEAARAHGALLSLEARQEGRIVGAALAWLEGGTAYFAYANAHPEARRVTPLPLLGEEIIRHAQERGCSLLDFTGSMDPKFEFFWRKFSLIPAPYVEVRGGV